MAQQIHSNGGESDDEEEGGWLSQSAFTLNDPPPSARHDRRAMGFDVGILS